MNHDLTDDEIDAVLQKQLYGHLGCTLPDRRVYIVPITYAWYDNALYSFSHPGLKIDVLRGNPSACLQTEEFLGEGIARSAIVWGRYEELSGAATIRATKILFDRLERDLGVPLSPLYHPPARALFPAVECAMKEKEAVFYRICIEKKTGKHIQYD